MDMTVGEGLLGRVIDPLGRPLDGNEPVNVSQRLPIERPAPPIMDRAPVTVPLQTGLKVIDALIPIGRGQRELILGDRQTGKTAIAIDAILNQRGKNVVCVYCVIGQRASAVAKVVANLREKGAMDYTVVVVAEGNDAPGLAYITPYAATSIAEHFMEAGRDVLIVYDNLTQHAQAYRGRFSAGSGLGDSPRRNFLLTDASGSIFNPFPNYSELSYEVSSIPPTATPAELRAAGSVYPADIRDTYLQLPTLDPRIPELARQATAAATNPYDKAVALQSYLQTRFAYTLDQGSTASNDPLANFLFVRKAGHCEYFATAMTVMLRTLGIPARYINGFQTGEYNDVGGDFIVRASDAHSWVEAYFPGRGWITFDPTPAGEAASPGWFASISKYMDWMQYQWGEWVINYDFLHQMSLGQGVGRTSRQWATGARERVTHSYDALVERMSHWQTVASSSRWAPEIIGLVIAAFIAMLAGKPLTKLFTRMWALRATGTHNLSPQRASAHYSEMLRLLARRGFRKADSITALEFAASILQPELSTPVGRLTEIYQAARFGGVPVEPRQSVELLREIRARITSIQSTRQ
jgi:transglutaminase-like putative cysteine protease